MNNATKIILLALTSVTVYACGSQEEKKDEKKEEPKEEETAKLNYFGDSITEAGAMTPAELLTAFVGKDSMQAKVAATITEVCQKKGCWMRVDMGDGTEMHGGLPVVMEGWAYVDTVSVEDQKHYLTDENATQEEIDAITEPKIELSFLATGLILKNE
jgi:hypothetical protein